jgi:hypothetical protein
MFMTGPWGSPVDIAMGRVVGPDRFQVARFTLVPNDELQRTLFEFGNQQFVPFQNPDQLRLGLNDAAGGRDLGDAIINADGSAGELTVRFPQGAPDASSYELTYKILPG